MNKITHKTQSNIKLLSLLAKRQRTTILKSNRDDWPGRKRPSFAQGLSLNRQQKSEKKFMKINTITKFNKLTNFTTITNSARSISLKPEKSTNSKRIIEVIRHEKLLEEQPQQIAPISRKMSDFQNKRLEQSGVRILKPELKSPPTKIEDKSEKKLTQAKDDLIENYTIDYLAFNYIEKVIDRPKMWAKFVHKKEWQNNNDDN